MFCLRPVKKLSRHKISWPSLSSRSHKCEPRKPAPPVMRIRISVKLNGAQSGLMPQLKKCLTKAWSERNSKRADLSGARSRNIAGTVFTGSVALFASFASCRPWSFSAQRFETIFPLPIVAEISKSSEHGTVQHDCYNFVLKMRRASCGMISWHLAPRRRRYLRRRSCKNNMPSRGRGGLD
jgi:hypothetical protein